MEKRFNFRIYPNSEQEVQIQISFNCCRFVYNYFLNRRIESYKNNDAILSLNECCRELTVLKNTEGYEWLKEADSSSLQYSLKDLDLAYKAFFRNVRKGKSCSGGGIAPGFPKFKSKKNTRKSYRSKNNSASRCQAKSIEIYDGRIKLPKLGLVKCKVTKGIDGRILSVSVFQSSEGDYYVSVCCTDFEPQSLPKTGASVGIQMGVKHLAVMSDGNEIENHRYYEQSQKKIARLNKALSRKTSDSANHEKARLRLAKAYKRLVNRKTDALQKATTQLVRDYDTICIRDVNHAEIMKNKLYAKYLSDAGWGAFVSQLEYKCGWYGKTLVKIDKFQPITRVCSICGELVPDVHKKSKWNCPKCGTTHERAYNAAKNILNEGMRLLATA